MNSIETAQRYFDAWNRHDAEAIIRTFAPGGTYEDPTTKGALSGIAIGDYAKSLWDGFPDLSFEILGVTQNDAGLVAGEWRMKGTNLGSFAGLPPSGHSIVLDGADIIRVGNEGIRSIHGYFDAGAVPRALGLDIVVQPKSIGPMTFGVATRATSGTMQHLARSASPAWKRGAKRRSRRSAKAAPRSLET